MDKFHSELLAHMLVGDQNNSACLHYKQVEGVGKQIMEL